MTCLSSHLLSNMLFIFSHLWQLPQALLGWLIVLWYTILGREKYFCRYKGSLVCFVGGLKVFSGACFGPIIILPIDQDVYIFKGRAEILNYRTVRHEYGHFLQGLILGPAYLFAIGIPSLINNLRSRIDELTYARYYDIYPEKWADKLGKVERWEK